MPPFRKYLSRAAGALALALTPTLAHAGDTASGRDISPAMWKLADEDTTIYMFGTVHVLPDNVDWMNASILNAFNGADQLVTEIDMQNMQAAGQIMATAGLIETGETLRSMMTEENRAEYEAALTSLEVPVAALDNLEPWFASLSLTLLPLVKSGYNPGSGVEMVFEGMAEGKSRAALETVEEQVELFDGMPVDAQLTMLDAAVEAIPEVKTTVESMVGEWLDGDADGLAAVMNENVTDPEIYQRLLVDRNANWVDWIETRLETPGTVFMAVGAGHLAGKGSVQDILSERGYTVERVQ